MIRSLLLIIAMTCFAIAGQACDGCGCSLSGGGIGLMTHANARYLGLSYRYSQFHLGEHSSSAITKDQFTDLQLVARIALSKNLLLQANLPYRIISRSGEETLPVNEKGIGDASLMASWTLMDKRSEKEQRFFWSVGAGMSMPTGRYDGIYDDRVPDHLHPGTDAWGMILQSNLSLQYSNWGINAQVSGTFRQTNSAAYRFGNQWTQSLMAFWRKDIGKIAIAPFAGVYSEIVQNGQRNGAFEIPSTAGNGFFGQLGIEANLGQVNWTAQVQLPMLQDYSAGEAKVQPRFSTSVAYLF